MEQVDVLESVLDLYEKNDWEKVLDLPRKIDDVENLRKLLWVWPSKDNFEFISDAVTAFGCEGVISIGCGCGLLEWCLQQAAGLPVIGYEVNEQWWNSRYSNPQFIKLNFPISETSSSGTRHHQLLNPNYALLFCYFNNRPAFLDYMRNYAGNLVFIIGPGDGAGRHTDPQPFAPDFGDSTWRLHGFQEVKNTKDFIAAYARSSSAAE